MGIRSLTRADLLPSVGESPHSAEGLNGAERWREGKALSGWLSALRHGPPALRLGLTTSAPGTTVLTSLDLQQEDRRRWVEE